MFLLIFAKLDFQFMVQNKPIRMKCIVGQQVVTLMPIVAIKTIMCWAAAISLYMNYGVRKAYLLVHIPDEME